jgi:hypothetical protein
VRADFREVRSISILVDPIVTSGVLYFDPPDLLARHATAPWTSRVVVTGKLVEFQDETGEHRLELDASALAEAVVSNLMFVLRGDLESLRASFEVSFESDSRDWKLTLVPRSRALWSVVKAITLSGRGRELASMQTLEVNGDATALHLSGVQVGATWSEQERASIFSIHPK